MTLIRTIMTPPLIPRKHHKHRSTHDQHKREDGSMMVGTKVVVREDLVAEVGQEGRIETGSFIPDDYFIEEKT